MKTMLRFSSLVLLCMILALCLCSTAFAEDGNISLPEDTLVIESGAFDSCAGMTSVTIPVSVKSIGSGVFSDCVNLHRVYFKGTQAQWQAVSISANNAPLNTAMCVFLGEQPTTATLKINGKNYAASYFGRVDISSWHDQYAYRDFWRLENAYDDFKNTRRTGDNLPESNYPMLITTGQVFVIDYALKSGGVFRQVLRCDGNLWEGMLTTHAIAVDVPPIRTETVTVNGKAYTAGYYGEENISAWSTTYSKRCFWRLENAYNDLRNCAFDGPELPENNFPMPVEVGQVYVADYTLKDGSGIWRHVMRCDGKLNGGLLVAQDISAVSPIRADIMEIGGKSYTATYYGGRDISSVDETYSSRNFWRLENAYNDLKDCPFAGDSLPQDNYPMTIEAGQVYVIEYTKKGGGIFREVMRCDGDLWEGMLVTHAIVVG